MLCQSSQLGRRTGMLSCVKWLARGDSPSMAVSQEGGLRLRLQPARAANGRGVPSPIVTVVEFPWCGPADRRSGLLAAGHSYLILAKHSFRRSSSERTCVSMASCNASVPLLDNSADAFLSRFCFQSRIACLVALWASDVALRYAFMQASAIEQVLHS